LAVEGVDAARPSGKRRQTVPTRAPRAERKTTVNLKKITGTATLAGAIGAAALGLGTGAAQADPKPRDPGPVSSDTDFTQPPGHVGQDIGSPPGQFNKLETIQVEINGEPVEIDNPFFGVPPGHWAEHQGDFEDAVAAASP
jgi:hypothetical protein